MSNGSGKKRKGTDDTQGPKRKKQRKACGVDVFSTYLSFNKADKMQVLKTNANITTQAHLLTIPGELRNVIYRLVLWSDECIKVDKTHRKMPPLLRTCQLIYAEACSIYLCENSFVVTARHLRPTFPRHHWILSKQKIRVDVSIKLIGKFDWENLVAWLAYYHRCKGEYLGCFRGHESAHKGTDHVSFAFSIVDRMLKAKWQDVRAVLEVYRESTELGKMKWV